MEYNKRISYLIEDTCMVCGKLFYPNVDWAYVVHLQRKTKNNNSSIIKRRVCSWSCLQKYNAEHPKRNKKKE